MSAVWLASLLSLFACSGHDHSHAGGGNDHDDYVTVMDAVPSSGNGIAEFLIKDKILEEVPGSSPTLLEIVATGQSDTGVFHRMVCRYEAGSQRVRSIVHQWSSESQEAVLSDPEGEVSCTDEACDLAYVDDYFQFNGQVLAGAGGQTSTLLGHLHAD